MHGDRESANIPTTDRPSGDRRARLGVGGGLGPLASAEFVKSLCRTSIGNCKEDAPVVLLHSDPTFPDRTTRFATGEDDEMLTRLVDALGRLRQADASPIVTCCVWIHHVLPRVPAELREHVVSLVDVIADAVLASPGRHLLVGTTGTLRLGEMAGVTNDAGGGRGRAHGPR